MDKPSIYPKLKSCLIFRHKKSSAIKNRAEYFFIVHQMSLSSEALCTANIQID
jgi:hypothetical protein